jgi:PIN domain nuclease of toxin-antitoxin system
MRLLLDTHIFLWRLTGDIRLLPSTESLIDDPSNSLFFSSISAFEILLKASNGKLKLPTDPATFIENGLRANQIAPLPLQMKHTYEITKLPMIHRDPFDRLLIATAIAEGMTLVTADATLQTYPVAIIL